MNMPLFSATLKRWGPKGGLAVLDQGFFSGSNFILNILLARWLDASEYGAYSITFALFLFVTGIHNSLILEPMAVLGPANHGNHRSEYLLNQFALHLAVTLFAGLLLALVGGLLFATSRASSVIGQSILGLGLFLPMIMLIWLVRRIFYVIQNPAGSLFSSAVYVIFLLGGSWLIHDRVTEPPLYYWFGILGIAGLISGLIPLLLWRSLLTNTPHNPKFVSMEVFSEHWTFGKWVMSATVFNFIATQIQIFAVATILSLDAAGAWRAAQNFILPMMQIITAIVTLALPSMASNFGRGELEWLKRKGLMVTILLFLLSVIYTSILVVFASPINRLFYVDKFVFTISLISMIGLVTILTAAESGFALILRTMQRPTYYLIYTVAMSISGLIFCPWLVWHLGLLGAGISQVVVGLTSLSVNAYLYKTWFHSMNIKEI